MSGFRSTPDDAFAHRAGAGGMWDEIGQLQFGYLVNEVGLRHADRFVDIGCGPLRLGVRPIPYLDADRYFGVDIDPDLIDGGRFEIEHAGLQDKHPQLRLSDDFDLDFGVRFDVAWAQSLFTHLPLNSIKLCLLKLAPLLADGGVLYATFFHNPRASSDPGVWRVPGQDRRRLTHIDRDPYCYDLTAFQWACAGTGLLVEHLGEWGHPRNQQMLRFSRATGPTPVAASAGVATTATGPTDVNTRTRRREIL